MLEKLKVYINIEFYYFDIYCWYLYFIIMLYDNEGIEGVLCVSIEGDLLFWIKGEFKKFGFGFWDDKKKICGIGLFEVVVVMVKVFKKLLFFFCVC